MPRRKAFINDLSVQERQELVNGWLGLPGWCLNKMRRHPGVKKIPAEDALQAGYHGLCIAAVRFDPSRGCKFSTYAVHWVFQAIRNHARDNASIVRAPQYDANVKEKSPERYRKIGQALAPVMGLGLDGGATDPIKELGVDDVGDRLYSPEEVADLRAALKRLPYRTRRIIEDRAQGMLLWQVAKREGLSRERIRQIEAEGMDFLRKAMGVIHE